MKCQERGRLKVESVRVEMYNTTRDLKKLSYTSPGRNEPSYSGQETRSTVSDTRHCLLNGAYGHLPGYGLLKQPALWRALLPFKFYTPSPEKKRQNSKGQSRMVGKGARGWGPPPVASAEGALSVSPFPSVNCRVAAVMAFTLSPWMAISASISLCFWSRSSTSSKCFPNSADKM